MQPDPYIQFLENWIGIGEDTKLHDQLHIHFGLGFSVNVKTSWISIRTPSSRKLFSCVGIFYYESYDISKNYRITLKDVTDFYQAYLLGKYWQSVSYWFIPKDIL